MSSAVKLISFVGLIFLPLIKCESVTSNEGLIDQIGTTTSIPDQVEIETTIAPVADATNNVESVIPILNLTTVAPDTEKLIQYSNFTSNEIFGTDESFNPETWEAPYEIQKEYPYYLSGFDDENRPIWIAQWGLMDMRKIILNKQEDNFVKYVQQAAHIIIKSHGIRSTPEHPVHSASFLIDFDGLKLDQLASVQTVAFCLRLARMTQPLLDQYTDKVLVVNANYLTELVMNIARPVLGGLFGRLTVFGTNRSRWIPQVTSHYPKNQLPEYYGGVKNPNYKPLIVVG